MNAEICFLTPLDGQRPFFRFFLFFCFFLDPSLTAIISHSPPYAHIWTDVFKRFPDCFLFYVVREYLVICYNKSIIAILKQMLQVLGYSFRLAYTFEWWNLQKFINSSKIKSKV